MKEATVVYLCRTLAGITMPYLNKFLDETLRA